jgi:hypothetical protein
MEKIASDSLDFETIPGLTLEDALEVLTEKEDAYEKNH